MSHHMKQDKELASKSYIEPIYNELAAMIPDGDWYYTPRLIKYLADLDQAKICRELPATDEAIAAKLGLEKEHVTAQIKELIKRGLLIRTEDGAKMPATVGAFIDFAATTPYNDARLDDNWYEMLRARLEEDDAVVAFSTFFAKSQLDGAPMNRVLPKWNAIKDIPGVMPCEDMREVLRPADGKLSTSRCMCKQIWPRRIPAMFEGTHPDEGHCIHFGKMAEHYINEMEIGKWLSWEEAMALMDGLDASPLCHMVVNAREVRWICQCDDQACVLIGTMRRSKEFGIHDGIAPSRFLAIFDAEKCNGCGICVTKCPFHAVKMNEEGNLAVIAAKECMGCGSCVVNCPTSALSMKIVRPPEHIPEHGLQWVETFYLQPKEPAMS
jgi:Pyruvate/2-oxoacid:ferredoxin oxidoreductase delta subunit